MQSSDAVVADRRFHRNQEISPLLRLPGELRNIIYGYSLDMNGINGIITTFRCYRKPPLLSGTGNTGSIMSLLLASRQLYNEFHSLVYRRCIFYIENSWKRKDAGVVRFKRQINSRLQASVKVLCVWGGPSWRKPGEEWPWNPRSRGTESGEWPFDGRWHPGSILGVPEVLPNLEKLIYSLAVRKSDHFTWDFWKIHLDQVEKMNKSWERPMMEVLFVSGYWNVLARRHANGEFEDLSKTPVHLSEYLK